MTAVPMLSLVMFTIVRYMSSEAIHRKHQAHEAHYRYSDAKCRLETVLQVHADPEHFDIVGLDPARHRFTAVAAQIGPVTAKRVPDDPVTEESKLTQRPFTPKETDSVSA